MSVQKKARTKTTRKKTSAAKASRKKPAGKAPTAAGKAPTAAGKAPSAAGKAPSAAGKAPSAARAGGARKLAAKRPAAKKAASRPTQAVSAELLMRRIVRKTQQTPEALDPADFYAAECTSIEPGSEPVVGIEALREKWEAWNAVVRTQRWKAKSQLVKGATICIEWEAALELADGREVELREVAVHETRSGKIVAERYYYDPAVLRAPTPEASESVTPSRSLQEVLEPPAPAPTPTGSPPLDPLDL